MSGKVDEKQVDRASSVDEKITHRDVEGHDENAVIHGTDGVTHRDVATLRHVADRVPFASFLVVVCEFAERWSYYGTANLYNNYIRAPLPRGSTTGAVLKADRDFGIAGALGRGQQTSYAIRTFNSFFVYVTPLLGGIIADAWWGRYKTIMVFSIICLAGHIILVGSATPSALANPSLSLGLLVVSILIIGIGAGCIKANVSPMVAEQYTGVMHKKTLKSGETVVVSPEVTIQSVYLWFYAAINLGACGSISAAFLARNNGYWVAYLVPTAIFFLVPFVLVFGKKQYVVTVPRGSILIEVFRVIGMAMNPAWSMNPATIVKNIKKADFWEVAKPSTYADGQVPEKITWDDEFVDEVARTCNACAVFLFFPIFWLCYSQIDGNLGTTAAGMTLRGTPNDLIQNLNPISIIVLVPIFERVIYPLLRKYKINFTPIKRITAGFLVAGIAMGYASALQSFIGKRSPCGPEAPSACEMFPGTPDARPWPSDINVWVVAGPYALVGMAEIFASITSLEYAFTKAPARMKSVVMAFAQLQTAIASAINFALTAVNTEEKFPWLYGSFAVVAWIFAGIFFLTFRGLDRREHELNQIGKGDRQGFVGETAEVTTKRMTLAQHEKSES